MWVSIKIILNLTRQIQKTKYDMIPFISISIKGKNVMSENRSVVSRRQGQEGEG